MLPVSMIPNQLMNGKYYEETDEFNNQFADEMNTAKLPNTECDSDQDSNNAETEKIKLQLLHLLLINNIFFQ